jgi:hypothetical protein
MASKRKFYRTIIQVEVLSETPYNETDLEQVAYDINQGEQSGKVSIISSDEMDGKTAATKLKEQGSDPDFFMLDIHGNDIHDDEDEDEDDEYKIRKMKD